MITRRMTDWAVTTTAHEAHHHRFRILPVPVLALSLHVPRERSPPIPRPDVSFRAPLLLVTIVAPCVVFSEALVSFDLSPSFIVRRIVSTADLPCSAAPDGGEREITRSLSLPSKPHRRKC